MNAESAAPKSRWLARAVSGRCGGQGEVRPAVRRDRKPLAWNGPRTGRIYNYPIRREEQEK
jgi:hypothetical protein